MNHRLINSLKHLVYSMRRHTHDPNRCFTVFANRRGGSTWLMEALLAGLGRGRYVDQPLSLYTLPFQLDGFFGYPYNGQYCSLGAQQAVRVADYLRSVQSGEIRVNEEWRFWSLAWLSGSDSTVVKVLHGNPIMPYIQDRLSGNILLFLRNPISQSISIKRSGWGNLLSSFLSDRRYCEEMLDRNSIEFCVEIEAQGSDLQKLVVEWVLDKMPIWKSRYSLKKKVHLMYNENLCIDPRAELDALAERFPVFDIQAMIASIQKPSRTTKISRGTTLPVAGRGLVCEWQQLLADEELDAIEMIFDVLDCPFYDRQKMLPMLADEIW